MSCEKQLSYQLQNEKPQVVMYAFPMPDSTLKIHASLSANILSTDNSEVLPDMNYSIKIDDKLVASGNYPEGEDWVNIPISPISTNNKIELTYNLVDGGVVKGTTIAPEAINIESIDTVSTFYINQEGIEEKMLRCIIELNDPIIIKNYYQIRVDYKATSTSTPELNEFETISYIKEDKVFLIREDETALINNIDYEGTFSDYLFNGQTYKVKLLVPFEYLTDDSGTLNQELHIHLYNLSPEYYKFIRTKIEEEFYRDYPVFEPINLFSNVDNGIGVIAGLAVDTTIIVLP
ncbi:DUF4249 family protein [Labilibacter marinus]|uniref:DUF4249 family protein n=1 Tax=Labilibacter marinus TaxID=1477105 RepID=UPI001300FBDC|nr:DUF4249 family protein [Labilibacter marinus]